MHRTGHRKWTLVSPFGLSIPPLSLPLSFPRCARDHIASGVRDLREQSVSRFPVLHTFPFHREHTHTHTVRLSHGPRIPAFAHEHRSAAFPPIFRAIRIPRSLCNERRESSERLLRGSQLTERGDFFTHHHRGGSTYLRWQKNGEYLRKLGERVGMYGVERMRVRTYIRGFSFSTSVGSHRSPRPNAYNYPLFATGGSIDFSRR